ncbi:MAG: D-glycero-beta-D-manno-heptose 1-phosphate adenylyltransferase [Bacteroidales bacterium]
MKNRLEIVKQKIITPDLFNQKRPVGKMVFTNGCFDILHKGHIHYLSSASDLGDYLVIGLNSDDSVRRLKGEDRPLQDEESRALILASLSFVDFVILFSEDTPHELIDKLKPDVLVKGGDYKAEEIVGYDLVTSRGGEVKIIDFVEGHSSSGIINKLKG